MGKQDGSRRQVTETPLDDPTARILHVDMDAFYASVELLRRPELRGLPVIVGHDSSRSVVTAATYEARKFGVNSAMPMSVARRLCPNAVVLEPHFDEYVRESRQVMGILGDVSPRVEQLSIDEAFVDVSGAIRLLGSPWAIGTAVRERVLRETGLVCSVGAAATKFVAKLASTRAKPDGLLVIPEERTIPFLHPQPVAALWGVGGHSEERLERLGLHTVGELAVAPIDMLRRAIGEAGAARLHELAWGRDPRVVTPGRVEKSVGHETTFGRDLHDRTDVHRELLRLADRVGARLRAGGMTARTVVLKLRFGDFTTISRSRTLGEATDLSRRLAEEARSLFDAVDTAGRGVRLLGVRGEQLGGPVVDAGLWDDDERWRDAEATVDAVASRFGPGTVLPAALLRPASPTRMRIE